VADRLDPYAADDARTESVRAERLLEDAWRCSGRA